MRTFVCRSCEGEAGGAELFLKGSDSILSPNAHIVNTKDI